MALTVGTKLGSHEITGLLGKGGMGEVYRARDTKLDRDVAIKVLPEAFARDAARMTRFGREAKLLAALDHPNIAAIYGLEDSGDTRALVMQLAEGPTLADRIAKAPIPIDEALPLARQIAEAFEYAHERGIIHRDLKPANLKVVGNDTVKVLDFGLAKAMDSELSAEDLSNSPTLSRQATQAGVLLGTAAYMSPEQAKGKPVDRRADIWAFGCVLYEMLTGTMAFQGDTATETLAAVIKEEPDWSRLPSATPALVRVLLQRCLRKDARQRLRDMGDARMSLDEVLSGVKDFLSALSQTSGALSDLMRFEISMPAKVTLGGTGVFAVSPDGRRLAFAANSSDGLRLWVRSLDSLEARPLYGSESQEMTVVFWSPDSRFLVFEASGKLKKIDIAGGPAQTLCETNGLVVGGAWNRDGVIIFGTASGGGIMRVSANGGVALPVTTLDPSRRETFHLRPSFLPDGRHFIYLRGSRDPENVGIYVGSLDVKPEEQDSKRLLPTHLAAAYVPPFETGMGQLLFIRDGTLMGQPFDASRFDVAGEPVPLAEQVGSAMTNGFYSASNTGVLVYRTGNRGNQLGWFDQRGKRLGTVGEPSTYGSVALSPDGTRAVVGRVEQNANVALWIMDLGRGTSARFTFGTTLTPFGIWSANGSRVVFPLANGGKFDLYQKIASGVRDHELLLESDESKVPRSCSRDGRFLLYQTLPPTTPTGELWVLPLEGDKKPIPFARTPFNHSEGQFSPDGRWVAYVSDESGHDEIYVRTFPLMNSAEVSSDDEGKWVISTAGGHAPRWSGDGKTLYYIATAGQLMAVPITADQAFRAGAPKALFNAPGSLLWAGPRRETWSVTLDGKRFLFVAGTEQRSGPFTVVLNWPVALKK